MEKLQLISKIEDCDAERTVAMSQVAEMKGTVKGFQTQSDELEKEVDDLSEEKERRGKFRL